jgi:hypothetical protein
MKAALSILAGLSMSLSFGCGKSSSDSGSSTFADSYCNEAAKCCSQAGPPNDGTTCRQWMQLASMGGTYNAQTGDACLAQMRSQVSAGTFCANLSASTPSPCDSVYGSSSNGTKQPGDACNVDSDCAPSASGKVACASLYVNSTWINKCQLQIPGKAGDTPCLGTQDGDMFISSSTSSATDIPAQGIVCNVTDGVQCTSGTCVALATAGATCAFSSECMRSTFCSSTQDKCVPRVAAGATCTGSDASECVDGYYCATGSCTAKAANGATCTTSDACQSDNCSEGTCQSGFGDLGMALLCGS